MIKGSLTNTTENGSFPKQSKLSSTTKIKAIGFFPVRIKIVLSGHIISETTAYSTK